MAKPVRVETTGMNSAKAPAFLGFNFGFLLATK